MKRWIMLIVVMLLGAMILSCKAGISRLLEPVFFKEAMELSRITELVKASKFTEAKNEFHDIILQGGMSARTLSLAFYNLGVMASPKDDQNGANVKLAISYYKEALRLNPELLSAKFNLELLYRTGIPQKKEPRFDPRDDEEKEKDEEMKNKKGRAELSPPIPPLGPLP